MEIVFGIAGLIAAVFVVVFGGRGLVNLVRGASERRHRSSAEVGEQQPAPLPAQDVRFTTTSDGVRIAYSVAGEGPPIVVAPGNANHVEADWGSPVWRHFWADLSRGHTLVRFDLRGCGLSDRDADPITFDGFILDLDAVVSVANLPTFTLLGLSRFGGPIAVEYAARNPDRIDHLVLLGAMLGAHARGQPSPASALLGLAREGWSRDDSIQLHLVEALAAHFIPDGSPELLGAVVAILRATMGADSMEKVLAARRYVDVAPSAAKITSPTLVIHSREDEMVRFENGRELAALIPNARFVALESKNHILMADEPAFAVFSSEVHRFLGTSAPP